MKLLKTRAGNDSFVERSMQTFNDEPKNKEIQTTAVNQNVSSQQLWNETENVLRL